MRAPVVYYRERLGIRRHRVEHYFLIASHRAFRSSTSELKAHFWKRGSRTGILTLEMSECTVCRCREVNGPRSPLKLSYQSPIFRRARVGLLGISGEVGMFEDKTISRFPEGTSLDSPYADSNFQPCLAFRLLMRELLYSLQRGKLNMRWLERRCDYLCSFETDGN